MFCLALKILRQLGEIASSGKNVNYGGVGGEFCAPKVGKFDLRIGVMAEAEF